MKVEKLKSMGMSFLALTFPWVVMLIDDNPFGALCAIVLQVTVIGWIPASMWAWRVVHPHTEVKKPNKSKKKDISAKNENSRDS